MSWIADVGRYVRRLVTLEQKVEDNTKEITALRKELRVLSDFSKKVAIIVENNQEVANNRHKLLIVQLQNELLKLENKMLLAGQNRRNDAGDLPPDPMS